jgi:hypothetical protein
MIVPDLIANFIPSVHPVVTSLFAVCDSLRSVACSGSISDSAWRIDSRAVSNSRAITNTTWRIYARTVADTGSITDTGTVRDVAGATSVTRQG